MYPDPTVYRFLLSLLNDVWVVVSVSLRRDFPPCSAERSKTSSMPVWSRRRCCVVLRRPRGGSRTMRWVQTNLIRPASSSHSSSEWIKYKTAFEREEMTRGWSIMEQIYWKLLQLQNSTWSDLRHFTFSDVDAFSLLEWSCGPRRFCTKNPFQCNRMWIMDHAVRLYVTWEMLQPVRSFRCFTKQKIAASESSTLMNVSETTVSSVLCRPNGQ